MKSYLQRLCTTAVVAFLLALTTLIAIPTTIYVYNTGEFTLRYVEFLVFAGIMFATAVLGTCAVLPLLRGDVFRLAVTLLFAMGVLCWFQGNVLVWDYGPLTGKTIPWQEHWVNATIDTPIWVAGLVLAMIFSRRLQPMLITISLVLVVVQVLNVAFLLPRLWQEERVASVKRYVIDDSRKFAYSTTKNAILIVLDEFQSDIFAQALESDSVSRESFDGFVYFPDALGSGTYTEIAVPTLLTGIAYDNSVSRKVYLEKAFLESSLLARAVAAGFEVDAFPWIGWANESMFFDARVASNYRLRDDEAESKLTLSEKQAKEAINLVDIALMRSVPHLLKPRIYNDHSWFLVGLISKLMPEQVKTGVAKDYTFDVNVIAKQARARLRVAGEKPSLKFYHLKGAHAPLSVNQQLEFTSEVFPYTRENYLAQLTAAVFSLGKFFDLLREARLYDATLIMVVGDHGSGGARELFVGEAGESTDPMHSTSGFQWDKARASPLMMIKRSGASGPIRESRAPASLFDVPATLLAELGIGQADGPGVSLFDIPEGKPRRRHFYAFDFTETTRQFLPPIRHYVVSGDSRRNASWKLLEVLSADD